LKTLPQSPKALLEELFAIFPKYRTDYDKYGPLYDDSIAAPTFHSILIEFTIFFGTESSSLSKTQLSDFGNLINEAVAQGGQFENAFDDCLLEHLHQIKAVQVLKPYLSDSARKKIYD